MLRGSRYLRRGSFWMADDGRWDLPVSALCWTSLRHKNSFFNSSCFNRIINWTCKISHSCFCSVIEAENIRGVIILRSHVNYLVIKSVILIRHQENHLPICVKSQVIFLSRSSICSFTRLETTQTSINQLSWRLLHLISGQVEQWRGKRGRRWIWGFTSRVSIWILFNVRQL